MAAAKGNGVFKAITLLTRDVGRLSKEEVAHIAKTYKSISGGSTKSTETKPETTPDTKPEQNPDEKGKAAAETKPEEKKILDVKDHVGELVEKGVIVDKSKKKDTPKKGLSSKELKKQKEILDTTLSELGIQGFTPQEPKEGPRLVRYIYKPEVKADLDKIRNKDLPLRLKTALNQAGADMNKDIDPIISQGPDGSMYIDIVKSKPDLVTQADVFKAHGDIKMNTDSGAAFPLALDVDGDPVSLNLAESDMTHIKVVGATGSGKGEVLKAIVTGLSRTCKPGEIEFEIIEPKAGAFNSIKDVKSLVSTPISDRKKILERLREIEKEMDRRNNLFKSEGSVENIKEYNRKATNKLPRKVILVDEMKYLLNLEDKDKKDDPDVKEITGILSRIGSTGRTAGIHMVLASQSASSRTFPAGLLGSCSTSICLTVNTPLDSKNMLNTGDGRDDASGMNLSKNGDAYIKIGAGGKKIRAQCPLVDKNDIEETHKYLGGKRINENNE
jgi:hypothetical protein